MEWITKHADTCIIIGSIAASLLWMNGKFNEVEREIGTVKTELAIVKAVLIMQKIMPSELATKDGIK